MCLFITEDKFERRRSLNDSSIIILDGSLNQPDENEPLILVDETHGVCINTTISIIDESMETVGKSDKNFNGTITLDDNSDEEHAVKTKQETNDLDSILSRLNQINITSVRKNVCVDKHKNQGFMKTKEAPFTDRIKSPLPFLMRMKKIYDKKINTSIFNNDSQNN